MKYKECNLKEGHKMDCSENLKKNDIINKIRIKAQMENNFNQRANAPISAPTILSVKDEKHHIICHTVVDYERIEEILEKIKDILERNHYHHEITVLPSENFFLGTLYAKDLQQ